jgi:hypothetical protein
MTDTPVTWPSISTPTIISMTPWEPPVEVSATQPVCAPPERALYRAGTPAAVKPVSS